jgi:hypothetical protein
MVTGTSQIHASGTVRFVLEAQYRHSTRPAGAVGTSCQPAREIFYCVTPGGFEVDFYLPEEQRLVQVTQALAAPATRERVLRALAEAVQSVKVKHALILSDANEAGLDVHGVPVEVRSTA